MAGAYAGVRVLDFSQGVGGPLAAALLADFDAEVIKVEGPEGDWTADQPGYLAWNRNKSKISLDLGDPAQRQAAKALIATADVVIFDHAPGVLEAMGLSADDCLNLNPAVIHAWTPPYGTTGRYSRLPADHALLTAMTGIAFRQASQKDQPVQLVTPLAWYCQAIMAASAIGAALIERQESGRGQGVVISGLHGAAEALAPAAGPVRRPSGPGYPQGASASFKLYECGDGRWLFLGTLFAHFFVKATEVTGVLEQLRAEAAERGDPMTGGAFGGAMPPTPPGRIRELMEIRLKQEPRDHWMKLFVENDVPAGMVQRREEWFCSETVAANHMRVELEHPKFGVVAVPGTPVHLLDTPGSVRHLMQRKGLADIPARPAPRHADHDPAWKDGPLAGIRVLDLGAVIAGAYGGSLLASYGADVVKVEPQEGDSFRSGGVGFGAYNRDKRGLGIDLKVEAGRAAFLDMVRSADVVLENYRSGVRDRLGLSDAVLLEVNPRLVICSISAYGAGPKALLPGFDPVLQAEGGIMAAQGGDGPPVQHTLNVNDVGSAAMACFGIVSALHARGITGKGQALVASLANTAVALQWGEVATFEGAQPYERGTHDCLGVSALRRFYQTADGWLAIAVRTPAQYAGLVEALGLDAALTYEDALLEARDGALAESITLALAGMARDTALDRLFAQGAPAAPAVRGDDSYDDPFLWENGYFEAYDHPTQGPTIGARTFADFSRTHHVMTKPVPDIGQHTTEVLRSYGIDDRRIIDLAAKGVVFGG